MLMKTRHCRILLTSALLFSPAFCVAQGELPKGVSKITSVEGITEYQLDNGLRFLVFPDPSKPTITVNMTYLVGSRHEGAGEGGMAHLLEHMLFKGSPKHLNIPQELTEHGSRPNGSTAWDRTNYFETFQATDENLKWALDLESDRMVNSFVRRADLDKEFSVVRNEFEAGENNPFSVLLEHTMSAAYTAHSYGRPVIGNRSDVERVPIDKLQAFYHKYYQPDNAVLTVAGKVDEPKIVALVDEYFGKIPRPSRTLSPTYTVEPAQDGERLTVVRRVGDIQAVFVVYHTPDGANPDQAALNVLASIMGEDYSGRLYKSLVDQKKATQIFADDFQLNEPGLIMFGAIVNKTDSIDAARDAMLATIDGVVKEPPTKKEVDRARTRLLKQIDLQLRNSEMVGLFLSEYLAQGDWRLLFLGRDRLRNVTPQDVQRVASAYLKSSNRTIGEFIPEAKPDRAEIPAKTDVMAEVKGYKGDAAMAAGEAFDPSPKNIEARTERYKLPSGMTVALLQKKTRGSDVQCLIRLHFGTVDGMMGREAAGEMAADTLIHGTATKNRQQIQDEIDKLKARLEIWSHKSTATGADVETTRENFPAALRLAGEILKEATLPESEFEQVRKERLTNLEYGKSETASLVSGQYHGWRPIRQWQSGGHHRRVPARQQIEQFTLFTLPTAGQFNIADTNPQVSSHNPGDANGDGKVDINDLTIVLSDFGQTGMTLGHGRFYRRRQGGHQRPDHRAGELRHGPPPHGHQGRAGAVMPGDAGRSRPPRRAAGFRSAAA